MGIDLVTGAGGFIAGHLVDDLIAQGRQVVAVDIKTFNDWFSENKLARNVAQLDLRDPYNCTSIPMMGQIDRVYNLAASMGGMGFIENNKAECMRSVSINTHLLEAFMDGDLRRYFYSSSACVYAADKQTHSDVTALKEADAYPAMAEDGYGWEKLFSEHMCRHFREDYGVPTRVARFHNVYGPRTSYDGGREKAPAAILRKTIQAKLSGDHTIEIWGDGEQTRSFMFIDDCIKGINLITDSENVEPINLGSSELVSINQLVDMAEDIAGIKLKRNYKLDAPLGVRGRNSDNTMIKALYDWEPSIKLRDGLEATYRWIFDEVKNG